MKFKKADWTLIREAEEQGLMVSMTNLVERNRTNLNNELSQYFREKMPNFQGSFDEEEGEEILYSINDFLKNIVANKRSIDFPYSSGTDVHLIPINNNIQLKLMVVDEYYGGEYSKYVMANFFLINEGTTKKDVDVLIDFVKEYLTL